MEQTDGELLASTAKGDPAAFGEFYRRHEKRILSYALARCSNSCDVSDLVAETFLGALRSAGRFTGDGGGEDALPWLFGIARRVLARQRRSFARRERLIRRLENLPSLNPDETSAVEDALDAGRLAPELAAALATLRPKDRELLYLVHRDELSPTQAGAVLGMNPNTARVRLSRARAKLRSTLGDRAPADDRPASGGTS
jgi:RNA polymerase sigma factor (sigma-70 family)